MRISFSAVALLTIGCATPAFGQVDPLKAGFLNPPETAKPLTWWHWMNGNVTKEGIKADLKAMKDIGLAGATIVNVDCGIPIGSDPFMTPQWREDVKYALSEASKLGLKISIENCAGWSSSAGPWITPQYAMQRLTANETQVHGPSSFDGPIAQPESNLNYYRDVAVLAFPDRAPKTFDNTPGNLEIVHATYGSPDGTQVNDVTDRVKELIHQGKESVSASSDMMGGDPAFGVVKELKLSFVLDGKPGVLTIGENGKLIFPVNQSHLKLAQSLERDSIKETFFQPVISERNQMTSVRKDEIVNLTGKLTPDGHLKWTVPPGDWVIMRVGYTPSGTTNHPAPQAGLGLECDKFSKEALDFHWKNFMQEMLKDAGPLAGKSLTGSLIDSYEVGNQDWSENFRREFKKRRGYDPVQYLPIFADHVVENEDVTRRFMWDIRRTVSDLFADNYFTHFAELCKQHGLSSQIEPYWGPFESLQCGASATDVMGEFWAGSQGNSSVKIATSVAHAYGKTIAGAESFTAGPESAKWTNDPFSMKTLGDLMFSQGINRYTFHRYAMQPWTNRSPGMTMGPFGIHFERTITWWDQGKAWIDYLTHCQYLLQQGRPIADVAYFTGQDSPVGTRYDQHLPAGYDYDGVNADVLMHSRVVDGKIRLASGATYSVLVLPQDDINMTPAMLRCIESLVRDGATVIGPRPQQSPSLEDYPRCDQEVKQITDRLWGACDGVKVLENKVGKGRIVWGTEVGQVLTSLQLSPDFKAPSEDEKSLAYCHRVSGDTDIYFVSNQSMKYLSASCLFRVQGKTPQIWRPDTGKVEAAPIWSSAGDRTKVDLSLEPAGSFFVIFRKSPEKVDPITSIASTIPNGGTGSGIYGQAPQWEAMSSDNHDTKVKLWDNGEVKLTSSTGKTYLAAVQDLPQSSEVKGSWNLKFPSGWGAPSEAKLDSLASWTENANSGIKYFSGTATYEKDVDVDADRLKPGCELWLDLGNVKNIAEVWVNGKNCGLLWKAPFMANITSAAKPGLNHLEIKVTNLWPNRLIGDEQLPPDREWNGDDLKAWPQWFLDGKPSPTGRYTFTTYHHYTKDSALLESGLLSPVVLRSAKIVSATAVN